MERTAKILWYEFEHTAYATLQLVEVSALCHLEHWLQLAKECVNHAGLRESYNMRSNRWKGSRGSRSIYHKRLKIKKGSGNHQRRSYTRFRDQPILHTSTRQNTLILLISLTAATTSAAGMLTTLLGGRSVLTFQANVRSVPDTMEGLPPCSP